MLPNRSAPQSVPDRNSTDGSASGRRRFLALGAGAATALLAGCSSVIDYLTGLVLADVNVLNATERRVRGSIAVTDPGGELVLDERFDLEANVDDDDDDDDVGEPLSAYEDVLTDAGEYTVRVDLDDGDEIGGEGAAEGTAEVTDPDEEHVLVLLGGEDRPIAIEVIESFTDLEEFDDA